MPSTTMAQLVSERVSHIPHPTYHTPPAIYNSNIPPSWLAKRTRENSTVTYQQHPLPKISVSQQQVSSSEGSVVNSGDVDRKFSKKTLARRQLVGGLTTPNLVKTTHLPGRSLSFRINSETQAKPQVLYGYNHPQRHSSFLPSYSPAPGKPTSINDKKTREVIESWNKLVQDIHSYHADHQADHPADHPYHLAVSSDTSSQKSPPTSNNLQTTHNKTPARTSRAMRQLVVSTDLYNEGLGVTRYRPLTPKLLLRLDGLKLPSHRLTQMWVDQLPERRRSYQMTCPPLAPSPGDPAVHSTRSRDQWSSSSGQLRHDFI